MVKKFKVKVNGEVFDVEIEEMSGKSELTGTSGASKPVEAITSKKEAEQKTLQSEKTVSKESSTPVSKKSSEVSGKKIVSAPLPGKIISVKVRKGDTVKKGDLLLVLEAMKMENEIFASTDGKILDILVSPGDYVSTGDKMIVME